MSKAFTKDDDGGGEIVVVPRAPLPAGVPNYVTPGGLAALEAELRELQRKRVVLEASEAPDRAARSHALAQRTSELETRLNGAQLVEPSTQPRAEVRFGARVWVETSSGETRVYRIVGVDEADAQIGLIAFTSPLARALLGKRVGDDAEVRTPRGAEELSVLAIEYDRDSSGEQ